jgi:hypothetical protein
MVKKVLPTAPTGLVLSSALVSSFSFPPRAPSLSIKQRAFRHGVATNQCALRHGVENGSRSLHAWRTTGLDPVAVNTTMVRIVLVSVHGHALTVPAKFTVGRGRDGARRVATDSRALLEGQQLLGAERLVVDLCGRLDEVLQVGAGEEVAEVYEFAMGFVLDCKGLAIECW